MALTIRPRKTKQRRTIGEGFRIGAGGFGQWHSRRIYALITDATAIPLDVTRRATVRTKGEQKLRDRMAALEAWRLAARQG